MPRECARCSKLFVPRNDGTVFCSAFCRVQKLMPPARGALSDDLQREIAQAKAEAGRVPLYRGDAEWG